MANQPDHVFKSITLTNFLSFGPEPTKVELSQLNVLIGPNGSGKTNFLQAIKLLRACVTNIDSFLDEGDSFSDILWSGQPTDGKFAIEAAAKTWDRPVKITTHRLSIGDTPFDSGFYLWSETVIEESERGSDAPTILYDRTQQEQMVLRKTRIEKDDGSSVTEPREVIESGIPWSSILALPDASDCLEPLRSTYRQIFQFEGDGLQHNVEARRAQKTDIDQTFLAADGSNLASVIEALQHKPAVMNEIMAYVRRFYPKAIRLVPGLVGSKVRLFLEEEGLAKDNARIPIVVRHDRIHHLGRDASPPESASAHLSGAA